MWELEKSDEEEDGIRVRVTHINKNAPLLALLPESQLEFLFYFYGKKMNEILLLNTLTEQMNAILKFLGEQKAKDFDMLIHLQNKDVCSFNKRMENELENKKKIFEREKEQKKVEIQKKFKEKEIRMAKCLWDCISSSENSDSYQCLLGYDNESYFDETFWLQRYNALLILQTLACVKQSDHLMQVLKDDAMDSRQYRSDSIFKFNIIPSNVNVYQDKLLGRGECGSVYEGSLKMGNSIKVVAVKIFNDEISKITKKFRDEVVLAYSMRHPNLVESYGISYLDSSNMRSMLMCMEIQWCSLKIVLEKMITGKRRFNIAEILKIALDFSLGLHFLHLSGIVHRDVSAGNCLISTDFTVKVSDFGHARVLDEHTSKSLSRNAGTPHFVAPEVLGQTYAFPSDIWSFGLLLTGICCCEFQELPEKRSDEKIQDLNRMRRELTDDERKEIDNLKEFLGVKDLWPILKRRQQSISSISQFPFKDLVTSCLCVVPSSRITVMKIIAELMIQKNILNDTTMPNIEWLLTGS